MRRDAGFVDVQLVEEEVPDGSRPSRTRPRPLSPDSVVRNRRSGLVVAVVAASVVGWIVIGGVLAPAEDARLARAGGATGSLDQPLQEVWRVTGSTAMATVDDALLLALPNDTGVAAVELATGDRRYSTPGRCALAFASEPDPDAPAVPALSERDLLLCEVAPRGRGASSSGDHATTLTVHDPATGAALRSFALRSVDDLSLSPRPHGMRSGWLPTGVMQAGQGWSPDVTRRRDVTELPGMVLIRHEDGVSAFDAASGDLRWTTPADRYGPTTRGMVTSGRNLLTAELNLLTLEAGVRLVARDVSTGEPVWAAPIPGFHPAELTVLQELPGDMVMVSGARGQLVALREPDARSTHRP